jgi:LmbE family N-acetylglucosaminyl deacetylase
MRRRAILRVSVLVFAVVWGPAGGRAQALPEAVEAIDRARVTTRILCITAHPDDEPASVLAYLAHGLGADVALLSITRGEGGQNALGPEQGPQLSLLRSQELLAATQVYGTRLFFTRAPDLGYVKTVEETQRIWAGTALGDMVRVIRTFRPNIVLNSWGGVHGGHGHHQTSGILTPQAVTAAADRKMFPEQLAEGIEPWKVDLVLERDRSENARGYAVPTDQVSPLWGRTYAEMGRDGDLNHRTQGIAGFLGGGGFLRFKVQLMTTEGSAPDPARLAERLPALAKRFPALAGVLEPRLSRADVVLSSARENALRLDWPAAAQLLAEAGKALAELEGELASKKEGPTIPGLAAARWELGRVRERVDLALALASGLRLEAQADRREIIAGESLRVIVAVRKRESVPAVVEEPSLILPAGWSAAKKTGKDEREDSRGGTRFDVHIPAGAQEKGPAGDWMFPHPAPLVRAVVRATLAGYSFSVDAPAVRIEASSTRVETLPLTLVPAVTLSLAPRQALLVEGRPQKPLEILARVHYYGSRAADVAVGVDAPAGWRVEEPAALQFDGPGDQLARLRVTLPEGLAAGSYTLGAYARWGSQIFRRTVEPLPTLPSQLWSEPASVSVRVFDLAVPESLRVGYVAAENDPIPGILGEIGIHVELLDPAALAFSDLSRFDAIAVGIRAYELRPDLARSNRRLLDFAAAGGTLVVQYQRANDWARLKPAPYPATVGQPTVRIVDENSPVRFLHPTHPALSFPNHIGAEDFRGWVQERGLYFWSEYDPRYVPLLALRDPGEEEVNGGLVAATTGKGNYIYTGLAFFRQLPEGVPGALRLFVNLLSQSRAARTAGTR